MKGWLCVNVPAQCMKLVQALAALELGVLVAP